MRTKMTGSGSAVGVADGPQVASMHPSATGNSVRARAENRELFICRLGRAWFLPQSGAIIMGWRAAEENHGDED